MPAVTTPVPDELEAISADLRDDGFVVLGAGLAGLGAARALASRGVRATILERESAVGGHAKTFSDGGFAFDEGPHVSFTKREDVKRLFAAAVRQKYRQSCATVMNIWNGQWVPHPAQFHLYGLPSDVVADCIADLAEAAREPAAPAPDFASWCQRAFGRTFSEQFIFRYTRKYWASEPSELTTDWVTPRFGVPSLRDMARGALSEVPTDRYYITEYRYPRKGGFGAYALGLASGLPVHLNADVVSLDLERRRLRLAGGTTVHYETLISSLPLPELVKRWSDAPSRIKDAARRLRATALVLVNLGCRGGSVRIPGDWVYVYDEGLPFARVHSPSRLSSAMAPRGSQSLQTETYVRDGTRRPRRDLTEAVINGIVKAGLVRSKDDILFASQRRIPIANVVFDSDRAKAVGEIRAELEKMGVRLCGRYGEWDYFWSDDSYVSGVRAANAGLPALPRKRRA